MKQSLLFASAAALSLCAYAASGSALASGDGPSRAYSGGSGTEADPYLISSVEDLNEFCTYAKANDCTGKVFKQTADIDMAKTALTFPLVSKEFSGTYDGGGYALKGLKITSYTLTYSGMFSTIAVDGLVKNLTLEGEATIAKQYCGILAGKVYGTIEGILSKVNINNTSSCVGGIVAVADTGGRISNCTYAGEFTVNNTKAGGIAYLSRRATLTNCSFTGTFKAGSAVKNYIGGIVAEASPSNFYNCTSTGIFPNDSTGQYRAGIISYAYVGATSTAYYGTYNIKGCKNHSNLLGAKYIGGIIGSNSMVAANTASNYMYRSHMNVDSCVNYGNIHATCPTSNSGGISGTFSHSTVISNCVNYGTMSSYQAMYVGGIAGNSGTAGTDSTYARIVKCYNYGTMKMNTANITNYYFGGIVGATGAYLRIDSCANYADLSGWYGIGGIVGYGTGSGHKVSGCVNYGNVTVGHKYAGGIVGYIYNPENEYTGNANYGNISTTSTLEGVNSTTAAGFSGYGIGGILGYGCGYFSNCLNAGTITGASYVGGIAGLCLVGSSVNYGISITNSLNTGGVINKYEDASGNLVSSLDYVGPILGVGTDNKDYWASAYGKLDGNYYTPASLAAFAQVDDTYLKNHPATEVSDLSLVNNSALLGSAWMVYDKYCWPSPKQASWCDMTKVWAAQVVPTQDDVLPNITTNFFVGRPEGLKWSSSISSLRIHGWEATWSEAAYNGPLTLTATCGDFSKTLNLNVAKTTGVDVIDGGEREIAEELWFTADGMKVSRPEGNDDRMYIVVRKYTDGTKEIIKTIAR